ncbi:unnamed protein product [Lymnaea stagnalis]|uniref:Uncharacterized protein n=1 Tax=Lymnaea stagnalis TaxID=6523 RepID=A0AAV2I079_LYMST
MIQTKRKFLDRVPRCEGGDEKQMYDCAPRGPVMQQKPQADNWTMRTTCKINDRKQVKTSPPSEDQFCGQKPRGVNFDMCGWDEPECLCKSNKCSSAGGWSTTKGEQEEETENEAEVQPGRRAVRRRGDIIRSCSSPCDTTSGSEKCGRKRVTFC